MSVSILRHAKSCMKTKSAHISFLVEVQPFDLQGIFADLFCNVFHDSIH